MLQRFLGKSGLSVSALSFGTMTFGAGQGRFAMVGGTHGDDAARQIALCRDVGVTLFDTADV